jgi:hypothetical protein
MLKSREIAAAAGSLQCFAPKRGCVSLIAALVVTMTVTVYAPDAGGINGRGIMADGGKPEIGFAACGFQYPFGTVFEFTSDMSRYDLPQAVECRDRGRYIGKRNLDVVIRTGDVELDLQIATAFGRRKLEVRIWENWDAYHESLLSDGAHVSRKRDRIPQSRVKFQAA